MIGRHTHFQENGDLPPWRGPSRKEKAAIFEGARANQSIYRNTCEHLGELEKVVKTLAYGSCCHCISHSPKLPLVFLTQ